VSAGAGGTGVSDPFVSQFGTVSLGLTWTFSDGGSTAGQIKQQVGASQVARANLDTVSQQAIADVSNASVDLAAALQRLELAQTESLNAQELVRISEGLYDGGLGQFLDITNAQASLVTAQTNLVQAKADVQRARARLRYAIGAMA
jgi:outer membrane protein TolC